MKRDYPLSYWGHPLVNFLWADPTHPVPPIFEMGPIGIPLHTVLLKWSGIFVGYQLFDKLSLAIHLLGFCKTKEIARIICAGSFKSSLQYWLGRLPLVFGPTNILILSPISRRYKNIALVRLLSVLAALVSLPFLYCGWFAPCGEFLDLWAPCILHALQPKAAGFWQGCLVRFDKTWHCFAPFCTLGRGICKVLYARLHPN